MGRQSNDNWATCLLNLLSFSLCSVSVYFDLINISVGKLISAHLFLFSHEAGVSRAGART